MLAVVIPCFRVKAHILSVISRIPASVEHIIIVDDRCPEQSGEFVRQSCSDSRVQIVTHAENQGVGGAMVSGYRRAIELGATVAVKIDGDGQMDPSLIPVFVKPLLEGKADYTKGNRFFRREFLAPMPWLRLLGNMALSFVTKAVSGYWGMMDPTNGYTAIHTHVLRQIPLDRLEKRYFFETDLLFHLGALRAVVKDIPMRAVYADETSSLNIKRVLLTWPTKYLSRIFKRFVYTYLLRNFNIATVELIAGSILLLAGGIWGADKWAHYSQLDVPAPTGTVMIAVLPILVGMQMILSFINYDIANSPSDPIHPYLAGREID